MCERRAGRSVTIVGAVLAAAAIMVAGCATVLVTDTLPPSNEKGFVDFYYDNGSAGWLLPITQLANGSEVSVGNTGSMWANKHRRVACIPGTNTFFVKPSSCVRRVDPIVRVGMVTPVRVAFRDARTERQAKSGIATTYFDIELAVDPPVPLNEYDARIQTQPSAAGSPPLTRSGASPLQYDLGDSVVLAPANGPRGYVGFRNESEGVQARKRLTAIWYRDPKGVVGVRVPNSRGFLDGRATNLFACAVGTQVFTLQGSRLKLQTSVQVVVKEGMVTPVSIKYGDETDLQGKVSVGAPYPMK